MVWTNRRALALKTGIITLIFKIVLLESSEVETHSNDRRTENRTKKRTENRTDIRAHYIKYRYLVSYLLNKKRILKIGPLELALDGGTDRQTDGRTSRRCQYLISI